MARLFLIRSIDDTKYIPMISDRKSTTLLDDPPLPTLETAKKNCTRPKAVQVKPLNSRSPYDFISSFLDVGFSLEQEDLAGTQACPFEKLILESYTKVTVCFLAFLLKAK